MKKKIITALTAVMIIASSAVPTMANTVGYKFTFYSPEGFVSSNSWTNNDKEQRYYLTINSSSIYSNNVFGTRIRRAADNATMSNYVKHTSQETSRSYAYTKSAKKSTLYYMRGKKDDCSTSSSQLNVIGRVTY